MSFTPVVTLIKYDVPNERLSDGSTVYVLSELELEGDEDICTQLLKVLEDNCTEPEHVVFEVLVVTEVLSIDSENVTEMDEVDKDADVLLSGCEVEETVGEVVSIVKEVRVIVFPAFPELSVTFIVQSLL